jgi:23S rRNA pseudouridine955/2504/2580 synthase
MRGSDIDKRYLTLTYGQWPENSTIVDKPLQKNSVIGGENMVVVDPAGKIAKTKFMVSQTFRQCQLMEVKLFTGRTHQIRVHAASSGHPVAGDSKYGQREFNKYLKQAGLARMFLHAWRLNIAHPRDEQRLQLEAPLPEDLQNFINKLT